MGSISNKTKSRIAVATLILCVFASAAYFAEPSVVAAGSIVSPKPTPKPKATPRKVKYSEFPHDTKAHKLDCTTCHKFPSENWKTVRTAADAFPDITEYPKHESCLNCHKQQFFKGARPAICSICHVAPSPRNSLRHPFPNPREVFDRSPKGKNAESDFVIGFPHDKHIEIVSIRRSNSGPFTNASFIRKGIMRAGEESCSVCHKTLSPQGDSAEEYFTPPPAKLGDGFWLKKGTFKSAPLGHTTCFTCHSADSGMLPAPTDCATCHKIKPVFAAADFDAKLAEPMKIEDKLIMQSWRRRDSSGKFAHDFFAHTELSCSTCHNVSTMNTADPKTMRVSIASCATCHVTATAGDGGALNYEADQRKASPAFQCVKCHTSFGKLPIPESHTKALAEAGK
ncbi:MAG: hypothetical protein IPK01_02965 [Acidobacteria bacterium]|nr:hypothetical protein [Acidobacteriota bacterium]